jgi:two-component system, OmpR family, response regulator
MRVLVVDDETRLVETLQRGLQGDGYLVDTAGDGEAGFRLACGGEYDAAASGVPQGGHARREWRTLDP